MGASSIEMPIYTKLLVPSQLSFPITIMIYIGAFVALLAATTNAASLIRRDTWGGALSLGPSKSTNLCRNNFNS